MISCIVHHDGFRRSYMSSADSSYYFSTSILHWKQNNKISMLLYRPCLCCHCYCTVHVDVVIAIVPSMFMWSLLLYRPCLCYHSLLWSCVVILSGSNSVQLTALHTFPLAATSHCHVGLILPSIQNIFVIVLNLSRQVFSAVLSCC